MCSELANLISDAWQGLGYLDKPLLETDDLARAVIHSLGLVKQSTDFSSQNLALQSYPFSPSGRDTTLSGAADLSVPAWLERQIGTEPHESWQMVPVVSLSALEPARNRGETRCAFYATNGMIHVRLSYFPSDYSYPSYRLWYSSNPILASTLSDIALDAQVTALPANFWPMISGMAELEVIPTILIHLAQLKEKNPELADALKERQGYLAVKIGNVPNWGDRMSHWVNGARGQSGGRRRRILNGARM